MPTTSPAGTTSTTTTIRSTTCSTATAPASSKTREPKPTTVPATSCSSEATGKSSGVAGLLYSAALNACGATLYGSCTSGAGMRLAAAKDCKRVNGTACAISADEVRQLLASGNIAGTTVNGSSTLGSNAPSAGNAAADAGEGGQADDVNTAQQPETACSVGMAAGCTDPNLNTTFALDEQGGVVGPLPDTFRFHSRPYSGLLANVSTATLKAMFPHGDPTSFTGNENGGTGQTSNGRPNTLPYAFTVRVVVSSAAGAPGPVMTGEDRRQLLLHRDAELMRGFPVETRGDGDASPVLVDLAGKDSNQLIVANSDGFIHAYQYNPATGSLSDLPGWPVHTEPLPLHTGEKAFTSHELSTAHYDPVLEAPAAGDLFGTGEVDIVADDIQGNVYAWNSKGKLVFHQTSNASYSGAPLAGNPSWEAERYGTRERTERGFLTSPVLGKLDSGGLDIIAAGEDRHVYAWHANGTPVGGFPVLVEDPTKVASVSSASNEITFNGNVPADQNKDEDQGKIVNTPAVAYLDGPGKPPSIVVGINEEYLANKGNEGEINASKVTATSLGVLGSVLSFGNSRVYAINASGCST